MKKATKAVATAMFVGALMAWSAGPALAGFSYEDCPPASDTGYANMSESALGNVLFLLPPEASNIHAKSGNPGNKSH